MIDISTHRMQGPVHITKGNEMTVVSTDIRTARHHPRRSPQKASLRLYVSVWMERRALSRMEPRTLADLGLTEAQAQAEARRPVWDLPANRT